MGLTATMVVIMGPAQVSPVEVHTPTVASVTAVVILFHQLMIPFLVEIYLLTAPPIEVCQTGILLHVWNFLKYKYSSLCPGWLGSWTRIMSPVSRNSKKIPLKRCSSLVIFSRSPSNTPPTSPTSTGTLPSKRILSDLTPVLLFLLVKLPTVKMALVLRDFFQQLSMDFGYPRQSRSPESKRHRPLHKEGLITKENHYCK